MIGCGVEVFYCSLLLLDFLISCLLLLVGGEICGDGHGMAFFSFPFSSSRDGELHRFWLLR
jgi:hypothetical protein